MKRITLCADDYGQNFAISQAIINLFSKNRLSATSCLTTSSAWLAAAADLLPYKHQVDLGLHFNLTEGSPLSPELLKKIGPFFPSLSKLMVMAYLRRLDKHAIRAELQCQLDQFVKGIGQLPDFIDGHQHVHQFPIIREVLVEVWETQLKNNRSYIRCTDGNANRSLHKRNASVKRAVIQWCGKSLKSYLTQQNIPHNTSFEGVYDFQSYSGQFSLFLQHIRDKGLIMCHPGLQQHDKTDSIAQARYSEYLYFMSEQFIWDCQKQEVECTRFIER